MKIYTITTVVIITLLSMSCNNTSSHQNNEEQNIALNDGQKWNVNAEMSPYILESEQILLQYNGTDHKQLAEELEAKNKALIKSCTMNGKSHDELHKWLHPHMQLIKSLKDAETNEESIAFIAELKNSFQTFHNYFQGI